MEPENGVIYQEEKSTVLKIKTFYLIKFKQMDKTTEK